MSSEYQIVTTDDWIEAFGQLQVGFWVCPDGHSAADSDKPGATVEWVGNVARCLRPGCHRTSARTFVCGGCQQTKPDSELGNGPGAALQLCGNCCAQAQVDGPF